MRGWDFLSRNGAKSGQDFAIGAAEQQYEQSHCSTVSQSKQDTEVPGNDSVWTVTLIKTSQSVLKEQFTSEINNDYFPTDL